MTSRPIPNLPPDVIRLILQAACAAVAPIPWKEESWISYEEEHKPYELLSRVARVNSLWHEVAQALMWRTVTVNTFPSVEACRDSLLATRCTTTELFINAFLGHSRWSTSISTMIGCCPNLHTLHLTGLELCEIRASDLLPLTSLRSLNLGEIFVVLDVDLVRSPFPFRLQQFGIMIRADIQDRQIESDLLGALLTTTLHSFRLETAFFPSGAGHILKTQYFPHFIRLAPHLRCLQLALQGDSDSYALVEDFSIACCHIEELTLDMRILAPSFGCSDAARALLTGLFQRNPLESLYLYNYDTLFKYRWFDDTLPCILSLIETSSTLQRITMDRGRKAWKEHCRTFSEGESELEAVWETCRRRGIKVEVIERQPSE